MAISKETRLKVYARFKGRCPGCGLPISLTETNRFAATFFECHHIYTKKEYHGDDRDEERNIAPLHGTTCHRGEHGVHGDNVALRDKLRAIADQMKPWDQRSQTNVARNIMKSSPEELEDARIRRKENYRREVQEFKNTHNGQSPWAYAREQAIITGAGKNEKPPKQKIKYDKVKAKEQREKGIDWFKSKNNGLTPYQVGKLRKQEWLAKKKKEDGKQ